MFVFFLPTMLFLYSLRCLCGRQGGTSGKRGARTGVFVQGFARWRGTTGGVCLHFFGAFCVRPVIFAGVLLVFGAFSSFDGLHAVDCRMEKVGTVCALSWIRELFYRTKASGWRFCPDSTVFQYPQGGRDEIDQCHYQAVPAR